MRDLVVFSAARSELDPAVQSWARFRDHIRAVHPLVSTKVPEAVVIAAPTPVRTAATFWRVLASNNRELARSYFLYPSFAAASAHVRRLVLSLDELTIVSVSGSGGLEQGWYATLGDTPVLTCSRWYGGTSTALQAAAGAIRSLGNAVLVDQAQTLGARRGRATASLGTAVRSDA